MTDAVREASTKGMLRADHIVHLRCEVTDEEVVELFDAVADHAAVGMMSLMDHAPGHRQYPDVKRFRERTMRTLRLSEADADAHIDLLLSSQERVVPQNRAARAERGKARGRVRTAEVRAAKERVSKVSARLSRYHYLNTLKPDITTYASSYL